jgi:hypothetical protein
MKYTSEKIQDQNLMYRITTINNGKEITFNVVCANDESEIEGLVQFHLDFINNPQPIVPQEPAQPTKEQLLAELQTLSNKIQALEGAA